MFFRFLLPLYRLLLDFMAFDELFGIIKVFICWIDILLVNYVLLLDWHPIGKLRFDILTTMSSELSSSLI